MDSILEFAKENSLKVMEDAAHALPTRYNGRLIGTFGDVTCFSFYANKTITTGEGGMLCTDDDEIAKRVKVMRLHGINRDVWDRFSTGHRGNMMWWLLGLNIICLISMPLWGFTS